MTKINIFIGYSHEDKYWLNQLNRFLKPGLPNDAKVWYDEGISTGEEWESKILEEIKEAHIAILLVSQDFFASTFIKETELPAILKATEKGLTIAWIYISDSAYEASHLQKIQCVNDPEKPLASLSSRHKRDKALKAIWKEIEELIEKKKAALNTLPGQVADDSAAQPVFKKGSDPKSPGNEFFKNITAYIRRIFGYENWKWLCVAGLITIPIVLFLAYWFCQPKSVNIESMGIKSYYLKRKYANIGIADYYKVDTATFSGSICDFTDSLFIKYDAPPPKDAFIEDDTLFIEFCFSQEAVNQKYEFKFDFGEDFKKNYLAHSTPAGLNGVEKKWYWFEEEGCNDVIVLWDKIDQPCLKIKITPTRIKK